MKTLLINAARCSSAVLLSAAVLLGAVSCGPKSTSHRNPEGLVSVNYADLKQGEDILISEWVGEPEFIALESRPVHHLRPLHRRLPQEQRDSIQTLRPCHG